MKVFICGGGSGDQTRKALRRLNEVIRHDLPCLYIPLAMEEEQYDSCLEWIRGELSGIEIPGIEMVRSAEELSRKRLQDYSFLFIGGGNTFRLLNEIKRVHMFGPIREYLHEGGTAFGGSAGAIIFGEDLESCALDDANEVGLKDTQGFDVLGGVSFLCHFTNRDPGHDRRSEEYLLKISDHRKTYALPEEDTLFLNEDRLEEIIDRPYYIFEQRRKTKVTGGEAAKFRKMRREKQALTREECIALLRTERRGVLSVQGDDGYPYGVPLNHYYKDGKLYFHGAKIGHRVDAIKKNPKVSFCVYGQDEKRDGDWAWHVKSVIVFGKAHIIESPEETAAAARELCSVFPVPDGYAEDEIAKDAHRTLCFFIEIEHMTGKTVHEA